LVTQAKGWRSLEMDMRTAAGETVTVSSGRPDPYFLVLPASFPWLPADANLIVIGCAFLAGTVTTIDILESKLVLERAPLGA
jgi:hypothetical protein